MGELERLKIILREKDLPFFEDDEIKFTLESSSSFNEAAYVLLIRKSEDTTINLSGFNVADTSKYFMRLAQMYRPSNSGVLA